MEVDEYVAHFGIDQDELTHHGIKSMKWEEHHARRMARADANEFAKARAYYGQGGGTRRKLVKAKVETRSQNTHYKKEFERVLSGQNADKRSDQAIIATGAIYPHKTGLDKNVYNKINAAASNKSTHEQVRQFLKSQRSSSKRNRRSPQTGSLCSTRSSSYS